MAKEAALGAALLFCRQGQDEGAGSTKVTLCRSLPSFPGQDSRYTECNLMWTTARSPGFTTLCTPVTSICWQQSALVTSGTGQLCSGASCNTPGTPKGSGKENTPLLQFLGNFTSQSFVSASFATQPRITTAARFDRGHLGWPSDSLTTFSITEVWF